MLQLRQVKNTPTIIPSIVGGAFAIFVIYLNTATTLWSTSYPLDVIFGGSLLAGFLAHRNGGNSRAAGIVAAVIAVAPMSILASTPVVYFIENYGIFGVGLALVSIILFLAFILLVSTIAGLVGGSIGGWIENKFAPKSST